MWRSFKFKAFSNAGPAANGGSPDRDNPEPEVFQRISRSGERPANRDVFGTLSFLRPSHPMTDDHFDAWTHDHDFDAGNRAGERGTRTVAVITLATMVLEIAAGWWTNSMALLADGWHMSSHAVAIGLSALAYVLARRQAADLRYAFGTWKIEILGGFASALVLLGVAGLMVVGSIDRLLAPQAIHYPEALLVAGLGLGVNLICAMILGDAHHHDHPHPDGHDDHPPHHDLNLRSAYVHVVADAATSVLAIVALAGGWWFGWSWLDPAMGLAGAVLVALWAKNLLQDTATILLDREMDAPVVAEIRTALTTAETRITDLHVWRVGRNAYACALSLVTRDPNLNPVAVRQWLAVHAEIAHTTIEINHLDRNAAINNADPPSTGTMP